MWFENKIAKNIQFLGNNWIILQRKFNRVIGQKKNPFYRIFPHLKPKLSCALQSECRTYPFSKFASYAYSRAGHRKQLWEVNRRGLENPQLSSGWCSRKQAWALPPGRHLLQTDPNTDLRGDRGTCSVQGTALCSQDTLALHSACSSASGVFSHTKHAVFLTWTSKEV